MNRLPTLLKIISDVFSITTEEDIYHILPRILDLANINIKIKGKEKLNNNIKKIYIANHTSYIDSAILFHVLKCGFMAASFTKDIWYLKHLINLLPLLLIDRGKTSNTVEKLKEFVDTKRSLCLFPEGIMTHQNTLSTFRTGAFMTGHPVQPIILKYKPYIYDTSMNNYITKLFSQEKITVTMTILDIEQPPFDNNKIEMIRHKMAKAGNFALSRVSNKDVVD